MDLLHDFIQTFVQRAAGDRAKAVPVFLRVSRSRMRRDCFRGDVYKRQDASGKDDGFQRIEFFEQAGRTAHFCIIETWANNKDLDTHAASANAKGFRTKIRCV